MLLWDKSMQVMVEQIGIVWNFCYQTKNETLEKVFLVLIYLMNYYGWFSIIVLTSNSQVTHASLRTCPCYQEPGLFLMWALQPAISNDDLYILATWACHIWQIFPEVYEKNIVIISSGYFLYFYLFNGTGLWPAYLATGHSPGRVSNCIPEVYYKILWLNCKISN